MKKEFPYVRWLAYIKGYPGTKKKTKIANNVKLDITTYFWIEGPKSHVNKFKRLNYH